MRIFYLFIVFLLLNLKLFAQHINPDTIIFSGAVLESDSLFGLPNAHIISHKNTATITDAQGQFSFKANLNDTITFSYVGYKSFVYVIPDTLKFRSYITGVILRRDTIELSEVIILPWMNKEQFKQAFINYQPDQQLLNARLNLNLACYQARVGQAKSFSSMEMIDYQMQMYTQQLEYSGMVSPANSFNVVGLVQLLFYYSYLQITKEEKDRYMQEELRRYIQKN